MNENLIDKMIEFESEITAKAWENGWDATPVYKYSSDGRLVGMEFEVEALVTHKSPPKGYPSEKTEYADPKNFKYPINSKSRVMAAWRYINKPGNQKGYSSSQVAAIKGRIKSAAKKYGLKLQEGS